MKKIFILTIFIFVLAWSFVYAKQHRISSMPQAGEPVSSTTGTTTSYLSNDQLLKLADNKYANGKNLPIGDYKYVTDAPKKGYIYLCNVRKDNPGSMVSGPWMGTNTWDATKKVAIQGSISWPNATFKNVINGTLRVLTGNMLPTNHTTGVFPVAKNDPAARYDPNPNTISAQILSQNIPSNPTYLETPNCMGGEVGVMLSGVPLFNGFDAGLRDAQAHEVQDSCNGHPQGSGQYHYHGMSQCFKNTNVTTVLGFAYDGFPITGSKVATDKYLTTEDLDVCHGITSDIILDGKKVQSYHYVMTADFPYSAGCFRGKSMMNPPQRQRQGGQMPPLH